MHWVHSVDILIDVTDASVNNVIRLKLIFLLHLFSKSFNIYDAVIHIPISCDEPCGDRLTELSQFRHLVCLLFLIENVKMLYYIGREYYVYTRCFLFLTYKL